MDILDKALHHYNKTIAYAKGFSIPDRNWNVQALMTSKYTPDCNHLFTRSHWYYFDYDMFHSPNQAIGFTDNKYRVWQKDLGTVSSGLVALEAKPTDAEIKSAPSWADPPTHRIAYPARVRGILRLLPTADYLKLDTDVENGVMFIRKHVNILVPQHTVMRIQVGNSPKYFRSEMSVRNMRAWMYVGSEEYFNSDDTGIDAGYLYKPARLTRPQSLWIGDFYTV
jgi:hypothetical protein